MAIISVRPSAIRNKPSRTIAAVSGVQVLGRLVRQYHVSVRERRSQQGKALCLAAGKALAVFPEHRRKSARQPADHAIRTETRGQIPEAFIVRHLATEGQVGAYARPQEGRTLPLPTPCAAGCNKSQYHQAPTRQPPRDPPLAE